MSEQKLILETARFNVVDMPAGPDLPNHRRQVIRHPGSVVLIPLVDDDHVCLIRNYRISVAKQLVELPAGTREVNEEPELTAHRELIEETGYRADSLQQLSSFLPAPGILDERMILYLARGLQPGPPQREPGEQIENWIVPWDQAIELVDSGQVEDAKTIIGLLLWDRMRRSAS
jgi:ADP-ribose pyrophosphatase